MRRIDLALAVLGPILCSGCSGPGGGDGPVGAVRSSIAYGTVDSTHTAVVAVLAPVSSSLGELEECTGSIVNVSGGKGYVLTAAHCCSTYTPTVVVMAQSYVSGETYVFGGAPQPPAYAVVPGSVYYDALYSQDSQRDHDFCMLQFSGAPSGTATLALPTTSDGLSLGSQVEHLGYGQTQDSSTNSERRTGIDTIDLQLTPLIVEFSQGGASAIPGTCDGDSGGPSLLPATAAQSQQTVVAVQSYGNSTVCSQITLGVGSRVLSAMGTGGFISSYLAGTPVGVQAGGAPPDAGGPPVGATGRGRMALVLLSACLMAAGIRTARARQRDYRA